MKEKREIKNRFTGKIIASGECNSLKELAVTFRADLRSADLTGAVLTGADLRSAVLRSAVLRSADLRSADLTGADLTGAVLTGADLRGADLRGAALRGAALRGADLRDAVLTDADLTDADLRDADLRDAKIDDYVCVGPFINISIFESYWPLFAYVAKDYGVRIVHQYCHLSMAEAKERWKDEETICVLLEMATVWAAKHGDAVVHLKSSKLRRIAAQVDLL